MSTAEGSSKRKRSLEATEPSRSLKPRVLVNDDDDLGPEFYKDIEGLETALQLVKGNVQNVQKRGRKKNEETLSSVYSDINASIDELKSQMEKERQSFDNALSKAKKECENSLKSEAAKFNALREKSNKEKAEHVKALEDTISKYEEEKEKLLSQHVHQREKENISIEAQEKVWANKIDELEDLLKKKDDKIISIFKKTVYSFFEPESHDDSKMMTETLKERPGTC